MKRNLTLKRNGVVMLRLFSFGRFRLGCIVLVLLVMAGAVMGQERGRPARRQPEKAKVATTPVSSTPAAKPSPSPSPSPRNGSSGVA